jgi:hypothetical protein
MNITDFGPVKPSITTFYGGYRVPVALQQVERPGMEHGTVEHSWQGYLLQIPFLSALEFDEAVKQLPAGDYSSERLAVLQERVRLERRAAYPPIEDYVYAVAEGDDAAVAAYKAKCAEVCCQCPMPWDASATYAAGDLVTHNGVKYRKLNDGDNSAPDDVPGGWEAV